MSQKIDYEKVYIPAEVIGKSPVTGKKRVKMQLSDEEGRCFFVDDKYLLTGEDLRNIFDEKSKEV